MGKIGLDTNIFIYHLEGHPSYSKKTTKIFKDIENGRDMGVTSVLTILELFVEPFRLKRFDLIKKYELLLLNFPNLEIRDLSYKIFIESAKIRANYNFKTPDAIQIATCLDCDYFLTNDLDLKCFKEIEVKTLDDV